MADHDYEGDKERNRKEFIYEQWRKYLTIFIVGDDINYGSRNGATLTNEQLRAIFNNGYKFALQQFREDLRDEMPNLNDSQIPLFEKLMSIIDDRFETQKCYVRYSKHWDEDHLKYAKLREKEFSEACKSSLREW